MTTAGVPDADTLAGPPASWWAARVGGLPRPFWFLWTGSIVNRAGSFVVPFLALYLTGTRDVTVAQAGVVLSLVGLGSAIGHTLGGVLSDRIGRRRTMVLGLLSSAVTLLVLGAASGFAAVTVAAFAYGLALDLFRPAVQAAVADLVSDADRPRAFALQFWAVNVGFSIATPLGGFLASRGYWLLFALDAATCAVFAFLILRAVPETRPVVTGMPGRLREVVGDRVMLALVVCVVAEASVYLQAFVTLPLAFKADGLGPGTYGAAIGLNGVLIVLIQPMMLTILGGRRRGRLLLIATAVQGAGFGLTAFADGIALHLLAITVWTLGEVLRAGLIGALVASLAPAHLRGRYMGVFGLSFGIASFVAPVLGTQVLSRAGESALWGGAFVVSVLAGIGLMLVSRAADRRTVTAVA